MKLKTLVFFWMLGAFLSLPPVHAASDDSALSGYFVDTATIHIALSTANNEARAMTQFMTGGDRWHFGRALQFLDTAQTIGFSVQNPEDFFNEARYAMRALELVRERRADALIIESHLVGGIRRAALKFIEDVEGGLSQISDTKVRDDARRRVRQARRDYDYAASAAEAKRFPKAFSYLRLVFGRFYLPDTFFISDKGVMNVFEFGLTKPAVGPDETVEAARKYLAAGDIDRGGYLVLESVEVLLANGDYRNAEALVRQFREILRGILTDDLIIGGDKALDEGRLIEAVNAYRTAFSTTNGRFR